MGKSYSAGMLLVSSILAVKERKHKENIRVSCEDSISSGISFCFCFEVIDEHDLEKVLRCEYSVAFKVVSELTTYFSSLKIETFRHFIPLPTE